VLRKLDRISQILSTMTMTQRPVHGVPSPQTLTKQTPSEHVLATVSYTEMLSILSQLGQVSEHAAEIFEGINKQVNETSVRVGKLSGKLQDMKKGAQSLQSEFNSKDPEYFYSRNKSSAWKRADPISHSFFRPETRPPVIEAMRTAANSPPQVDLLDKHVGPAGTCMLKYSNPGFFMQEWIKAEQERQEEERKERKERKKNRKKKDKKGKARRIKKAEAVKVKHYSAMGQEFAAEESQQTHHKQARPSAHVSAPPPQPKGRSGPPSAPPSHTQSSAPPVPPPASGSRGSAPPPVPPPVHSGAPPPVPPPVGHSAPPVPPPMRGGPPPPPVPSAPQVSSSGPPAPPVSRGGPPAPPVAPTAPAVMAPMAPAVSMAPAPPPVRASPPSSAGNEPRGGLLDAIRGGANLKRVEVERLPPKKTDSRGGLMDEIRMRSVALKKVVREEKKPDAAPVGGLGNIMDILSRRAAIVGSDDEDSDSDDDDWD